MPNVYYEVCGNVIESSRYK